MGNFEKLSVLVIVVIIVMILAVAVVEWTSDTTEPAPEADGTTHASLLTPPPEPLPAPRPAADPKKPLKAEGDAKGSGLLDLEKWLHDGGKDDFKESPPGQPKVVADPPKPVPAVPPAPSATDIPETTHVVAQGETLGEIAKKYYGKSSLYPAILEANPGITPTTLRPKQTLKIPAMKGLAQGGSKPSGMSASAGGPGERPVAGKDYTVRAGDTLESISQSAFGTQQRWPEIYLKNINRMRDQKDLPAGKVIFIPSK